jgi:hypothetical protein
LFYTVKQLDFIMNKQVVYKGSVLAKGSTALELWELWQREKKDRNAAQKKLDQHMKEVEQRHRDLLERYK